MFYAAIEQNPVIVQSLVDRYKSGTLSYNVPYIHMNTVSLAAGTNNISTRYSAPFGHRLQRVIWCPFLNDGAASGTYGKYDNSNMIVGGNATKVSSFYTMVNNVRTTQFDYNRKLGNEWMVAKDRLVGSSILSSDEFYYNFVHYEDFTGSLTTNHDPNLEEGLLLSEGEIKYDIQANTEVNLSHYVFAVTLRKLTISPTGATLF